LREKNPANPVNPVQIPLASQPGQAQGSNNEASQMADKYEQAE
jgi:hypothetical protein